MTRDTNFGPSSLPWWRKITAVSRVDWLAKTTPDGVYTASPRDPLAYEAGYREITYAQLANAVNGIARLLEDALGRGQNFETLAYIGPNDVRYVAVILGAVKAGYKILLTSPRNSIAAQEYLYSKTGCKTILSPVPRPPPVTAILDSLQIRHLAIPSVDELIAQEYEYYPYTKTYDEAEGDGFVVVHTSGSTGMPKPLVWTHQYVAANIEQLSYEPPIGYDSQDRMIQKNRVYITFPPFHGAALACLIFNGLSQGTVMITPTSGAIPTGQGLADALRQTKIDVAFLVPSIVLDLAQDSELLDFVANRVQKIFYCGGDLPQAIGDVVAAKVPLYNQYGASEMGLTHQICSSGRDFSDWKYIEVHPGVSAEMRPITEDLFEYTIVRKPAGEFQPATFAIFPELGQYGTRDLYVRHPSNPQLWKWQARLDDVIVFLNGEKTNPNSFEQHIVASNSKVARALVTGSQRFQASLLIEPVDNKAFLSTAERAAFIESIWPSIEEANKVCPTHAKIDKSHILFTTPDKPMMLAGKGTVQRAGTIALFEEELDRLYADADVMDSLDPDTDPPILNLDDIEAVSQFIEKVVLQATDIRNLGPEDNFFALGMDSLQALLTLRRLKQGPRLDALTLSTVYTNASIASLSKAVIHLAHSASVSQNLRAQHDTEKMQQLLKEHQDQIDGLMPSIIKKSSTEGLNKGVSVLITGSTGALGCHLLHEVLSNTEVTAVFCLNRATDGGMGLQASRLAARGLNNSIISDPRVSFHHFDVSSSSLGLNETTLSRLQNSATHVIHAAWAVDFNLTLDAFEPHITGTVNMLGFAASCRHKVTMMFISSISSVMGYQAKSHSMVPEVPMTDVTASAPIGYGQSKLLAELLLSYACHKFPKGHINLAVARVGQVAGAIGNPSLGGTQKIVTWNPNEWFPSLILSSVHVGALPDRLGAMSRIDWIPIDDLSSILVELTISSAARTDNVGEVQVYHPFNPKTTDWEFVRKAVAEEIKVQTQKSLKIVPLGTWLELVQKSLETGATDDKGASKTKAIGDKDLAELLKLNPAAKLLEWYRNALGSPHTGSILETTETRERSQILQKYGGLQAVWFKKWVREWLNSVK